MKRWGGTDRRAGSRPAAFRLAAVAAYPEERETPQENSQPVADRFPDAFPVFLAERLGMGGLVPIAVQAQGLAAFRLAAVAAYPEEREKPVENSQPAADRSPRAFLILPAARLVALEKSCL